MPTTDAAQGLCGVVHPDVLLRITFTFMLGLAPSLCFHRPGDIFFKTTLQHFHSILPPHLHLPTCPMLGTIAV